ncbi:hypothetical protein BDZ90DRAFT_73671 [Jaminaea rosea]|uniref:Uncharacterized protein n=1 Tax=Jaminaea rosea TaxID=1569628 RepID=A0A316ULU3_9BASI|nr:hypothetical protein BDZ90DRAFT_73671 [Jaminaea rosea]PWN25351.1 hypothetical protein BDZ90DRAFT_73671 [Jaminaea rosea]
MSRYGQPAIWASPPSSADSDSLWTNSIIFPSTSDDGMLTPPRRYSSIVDVSAPASTHGGDDETDASLQLTNDAAPLSPGQFCWNFSPRESIQRWSSRLTRAYIALVANLHSISQAMLAQDVPSYISARSANSIISESRPTRIQAETLSFLNRILDELLLFIVASSRSLATDRIKTNGLLRVLNNNVLAKDAVLEAELELRNYLQGKKAEGGRVPLGLSATSRWDGTEAFPVASAYAALRTRCQYYSTLGDREDEAATGDQHIMSPEGRPIATITPGVSIYVTALLEFVGEYILQHVAAIIERDNSDEAGLADLRAAIEEDEQMITLWRQMVVKQELEKRMQALGAIGGRTRRSIRPWKVPTGDEVDEAATDIAQWRATGSTAGHGGSGNRNRPGTSASISGPPPSWPVRDRSSSLGHAGTASDSYHNDTMSDSHGSVPASGSQTTNITTPSTEAPPALTRRSSIEKGLSGFFGAGRRRGSFKQQSQDFSAGGQGGRPSLAALKSGAANVDSNRPPDVNVEPADDFEALMMSGQTMKVSLTPNRLRTIEIERKAAESKKKEARQRPGVLNFASLKGDSGEASPRGGGGTSPAPTLTTLNERPSSRASSGGAPSPAPATTRKASSRVSAPPPSSYRGPSDPLTSASGQQSTSGGAPPPSPPNKDMSHARSRKMGRSASGDAQTQATKLQPRDKRASWSAAKDMMDLFNSTPPSPSTNAGGRFAGVAPEAGLAGGNNSNDSSISRVGGKMRALLGGRKSLSNATGGSQSPTTSFDRDRSESRQSNVVTPTIGTPVDIAETNEEEQRNVASPTDYAPASASSQGHGTSNSEHGGEFGLAGRLPGVVAPATQHGRSVSGVSNLSSFAGEAERRGSQQLEVPTPIDGNKTPLSSQPGVMDQTAPAGLSPPSAEDGSPSHTPVSYRGSVPSTPLPPAMPSPLDAARPDGPPSRKIPIGRRASRDEAPMMLRRRASVRSQMSDGAAGDQMGASATGGSTGGRFERANGTNSAMGFASQTTPMNRSSATFGYSHQGFGPGTPTSPNRPLNGYGGGIVRSASASSSAAGATSTLRVLAGLDKQMRACASVEECRALVSEALNVALREATTSAAAADGGPRSPTAQLKGLNLFSPKSDVKSVTSAPLPAHLVNTQTSQARAQPVLIMSNNYEEDDDETSAAFARNGSVAAWLLDDYAEPLPSRTDDSIPATRGPRMPTGGSGGSATTSKSMRTATSVVKGRSSSAVISSSTGEEDLSHSSSLSNTHHPRRSLDPYGPDSKRSRKISTNTVDEPNMYASADEGDDLDDEEVRGARSGSAGLMVDDELDDSPPPVDPGYEAAEDTATESSDASLSAAPTKTSRQPSTQASTSTSRSQRHPPSASKAAVRLARQEGRERM